MRLTMYQPSGNPFTERTHSPCNYHSKTRNTTEHRTNLTGKPSTCILETHMQASLPHSLSTRCSSGGPRKPPRAPNHRSSHPQDCPRRPSALPPRRRPSRTSRPPVATPRSRTGARRPPRRSRGSKRAQNKDALRTSPASKRPPHVRTPTQPRRPLPSHDLRGQEWAWACACTTGGRGRSGTRA